MEKIGIRRSSKNCVNEAPLIIEEDSHGDVENAVDPNLSSMEEVSTRQNNNIDDIDVNFPTLADENVTNQSFDSTDDTVCDSIKQKPIPLANSVLGLLGNDLGRYINPRVDDLTKYNLLQNHWKPTRTYNFPCSMDHDKNGKAIKRYLGMQHLEYCQWVVLSPLLQGLLYTFCVLFSREKAGHNKTVTVQKFLSEPVTVFKKLLGS